MGQNIHPEVAKIRATIAVKERDGHDTSVLRRDLRAAMLAKRIKETVDAAPPLTDEQRQQLAALLAPGGAA